jgi:hypothetical protein
MDDAWREQRDRRSIGQPLVPTEVVADCAVVDDEQRPDVVGVRRVCMLGEPGVQDLTDARHRRLPGEDGVVPDVHDRRIVQDRVGRLL